LTNSAQRFLPAASDPTTAWLFPGQGAQEVGMGRDLYAASAAARAVFDTADEVLGYALTEVCFEGPEDRLRDTRYAQPAILTASLACLAAAIESGRITQAPGFAAGHSLGEYTALVAAGSLSLEDGLRLIQERSRLMAEAAEAYPGTLAAILGLDEQTVAAVCRDADVDVCNLNLQSQIVIGGPREAVRRAMELAKERGALRTVELNVSGAFHSRLMERAVEGLRAAVAAADIEPPYVPVVANASAEPLGGVTSVRQELGVQIARPVRWYESVSFMAAAGATRFIEFGPGHVLTGLVKRIVPGAALENISTLAEASPAGEALPAAHR
jgi:[acyl-carrier-protein] S-malonyltransferase